MDFSRLNGVRGFLLDMDGTVYLGERLLPGARQFLDLLDGRGVPYYFLTNNSSRSRADYRVKLERLGLAVEEERILTSGEATAVYLGQRRPGARLYLAGTPSLEAEFRRHGFELVEQAPDFVVLGFDTTLTYEKIRKLCDFVREGRPYLATHPDVNCPTETGYIPDTGSMIALVAASTGRQPDVIVGKPHAPIVAVVTARTGIPAGDLAVVGDRLYTDIALGAAGLTTVLVLSGESRAEDLPGSPFQPDFVVRDLAELAERMRGG
jgi:4-nitrophenyl phosphatase